MDCKKYLKDNFIPYSICEPIYEYNIFNKLIVVNDLLNYSINSLKPESLQNIIRKRKEKQLDLYLVLYDYCLNKFNFNKYVNKGEQENE